MTNQEIQTAQQASESDMRAIQNMFERAANAIVNASQLGKEVDALRVQVNTLVTDTNRLRETISWLEQENATLRTQRDEAQNSLSDAQHNIDNYVSKLDKANDAIVLYTSERDNARGEAKLWQEEAGNLEKERNGLRIEVNYLTGLLDKVWIGIKDHFEVKPIEHKTVAELNKAEAPSHAAYHDVPIASIQPHTPEATHDYIRDHQNF